MSQINSQSTKHEGGKLLPLIVDVLRHHSMIDINLPIGGRDYFLSTIGEVVRVSYTASCPGSDNCAESVDQLNKRGTGLVWCEWGSGNTHQIIAICDVPLSEMSADRLNATLDLLATEIDGLFALLRRRRTK
ncbi:MAG: hypothetical protein KDB27_21085 [Planctomycetales bacterium]|nr:hypothetical protein [Planctomycetales bacterium]